MQAKDVLNRMTLLADFHKAKIKEKQEARRKLDAEIEVHRESQDLIDKSIREIQEALDKVNEKIEEEIK